MKKIVCLFIFTFSFFSYGAAKSPDIFVYSKLEKNWNLFLLDEFQQVMNNFSVGINPHTYVYESGPIIYEDATIKEFLTPDAAKLISKIQEAAQLDILNLKPQVVIKNLGYEVDKIIPIATPVEDNKGEVTLHTNMSLRGLKVYSDEVQLNLVLNDLNGKKLQALKVIVQEPLVTIDPDKFLNFAFDLRFEEHREMIQLRFDRGDFSDIAKFIKENPDSINITYKDIIIPSVHLTLMGRQITVNAERIKQTVDYNKEQIEAILLEQLTSIIEKNGAMDLLKKFEKTLYKKVRWFNTNSLNNSVMNLSLDNFSAIKGTNILMTEINGDFCTPYQYSSYREDCVNHREVKKSLSKIDAKSTKESKKNIEKLLKADEDIKFVASISEDYINNIISHTIEMGYWNDLFGDMGISLGDKAISARMNKKGNKATIFIDAIKDVGGFTGSLLRERYVQFPVVLEVAVRVEYQDAVLETGIENAMPVVRSMPHLMMKILDVDLSDKTLLYGVEEFDLVSNIHNVRKIFRKKVLKTIRKELFGYDAPSDFKEETDYGRGVDLPGLMFPELHKLQLEDADIASDGKGRLNIILRESKLKK